MESSNLQRGIQLYELGRYKEASTYFQQDLENWDARFYLAQSYYMLDDYPKSKELANELLYESPDNKDVFFLKARLALALDDEKGALDYIDECLNRDPYEAIFFGFKSNILLSLKKYNEGLQAANEGLSIDPQNSLCLNIRAQHLTKLNRVSEAETTVKDILFSNPEDAYSHANIGWVALENNNIEKALHHFKEALRHNPNFEYAREGMSTALKSKNLIYRAYLKYNFWISKQSSKNQWIFIIGIYLVYRFSFKFLSDSGMTYLAIPLMLAYLLFALGSWIMEPMSNAILSLNHYGKFLLSLDEKHSGYAFATLTGLGLISIIIFYSTDIAYFLPLAVASFSALIPLPRAFLQTTKKARIFGFATGGLIMIIGLLGFIFIQSEVAPIVAPFLIMVAFTWLSNIVE